MKKKLLSTATKTLASLLLLGVTPVAQASLEYESLSGGSVIYDTVTKTTWTQDGNLSGDSFTRQAAQNWAATLNYAGFQHWALPNTTQFTSLFTQLYPYGAPGLESNKYGASVAFGPGANDHALNVQTEYWTNTANTDFNFYYGYPGLRADSSKFAAWAVVVPEPAEWAMLLLGLPLIGRAVRHKKMSHSQTAAA